MPARRKVNRSNDDIMPRHHGHSEKIDRSEYIAEILPHDIPRAKSRYKVREAASESSSERSLKQMIRDECC